MSKSYVIIELKMQNNLIIKKVSLNRMRNPNDNKTTDVKQQTSKRRDVL